MNTIQTLAPAQAYTADYRATALDSAEEDLSAPPTAPAPATEKTSLSPAASYLTQLFSTASDWLRQEHLVPWPGIRYSYGSHGYMIDEEGSYINIEKYNNYLFDRAADSIVEEAGKQGIALEKKDVLAQLKDENQEIAALKFDIQALREKVGPSHSSYYLSILDINVITDMAITLREQGHTIKQDLRTGPHTRGSAGDFLGAMALKVGCYRTWGAYMVPGKVFPLGFDFTGKSQEEIDAAELLPPKEMMEYAKEIKEKLLLAGGMGIESGFWEQYLDPRIGLEHTDENLRVLADLLDIYNGKKSIRPFRLDFSAIQSPEQTSYTVHAAFNNTSHAPFGQDNADDRAAYHQTQETHHEQG
jgi:hypothetical protein